LTLNWLDGIIFLHNSLNWSNFGPNSSWMIWLEGEVWGLHGVYGEFSGAISHSVGSSFCGCYELFDCPFGDPALALPSWVAGWQTNQRPRIASLG
jgi:hypothetical protein